MPRLSLPPAFLKASLGLLAFLPAAAPAATPPPDPWKTALAFDYTAASDRFAELHAAAPADARLSLAYASSLLVRQPRTESNIEAAHALLLATASAPSASADESALALYLLARVELDHLSPAQPAAARAHLEQLRREHPASPFADQAAVQLAYLLAYPSGGDADASALPAIDRLAATIKSPAAARDVHLLLGGLRLRLLHDTAAALPHFIAARRTGFEQPLRNADLDLTIANLARETGDTALARSHYAAFLAAAPRDSRAFTVRRLLAGLSPATR